MSLIIEGMKMPEYKDVFGDERGCVYLLMLTVNKDGTAFMQFNDVDGGFYRVKEIRTPHGRLIDADRLLALVEKEVNNTCIGCEPEPDDCCAYDRFKEIISEIKTAPTIIKAEVSE